MLKEFKEFAMRGNVIDMAVGIIVGGAGYTYYKGLSLLFVGYSHKSLPLSSLHL